jgi:hypothetical protein
MEVPAPPPATALARIMAESDRAQRAAAEISAAAKKDMAELGRLCMKYNLVVVAAPAPDERVPELKPQTYVQARLAAEEIIRTYGRPVPTKELWRLVADRGVRFHNSQLPEQALAGYLHRFEKFHYYPKVGWWLTDVEWPPSPETVAAASPSPAPKPAPSKVNGHAAEADPAKPHRSGRQRSALTQQLIEVTRDFMRGKADPVPTAVIYTHVIEAGVVFPPEITRPPISKMVEAMKTSGLFRAYGRAGWVLLPEYNQ